MKIAFFYLKNNICFWQLLLLTASAYDSFCWVRDNLNSQNKNFGGDQDDSWKHQVNSKTDTFSEKMNKKFSKH